MSADDGRNVLVTVLAQHIKKASLSSVGGASPPGDPPVQALPTAGGAEKQPDVRCEVCGQPFLHIGQRKSRIVSEEEWYGEHEGEDLYADRKRVERDVNEFISRIAESTKREMKEKGIPLSQLLTGPLRKRRDRNNQLIEKFEARRDTLNSVRDSNCALLPEPPRDIYRVTSAIQKKMLDAEWDLTRAEFEESNGLEPGGSVYRKVPLSAGGCPASDENAVSAAKLKGKCIELYTKLEAARTDAEDRWATGGF